jgi:DUF4097 and DUF4098 domain-containing protein YvlB
MMLTPIAIGLLSAVTMVPQTDTVVTLQGETRLELELWAGEVVVQTWDRNAVQISAEHSDRIDVETSHAGSVLEIGLDITRGFRPLPVDFQLTVPRGMDLEIGGMSITVSVEGIEGDVEIGSVNGDIEIRESSGDIVAESVNGQVLIDGAQGRIEVTGVAQQVTIRNASGEIVAETMAGQLRLENVSASYIEAGTVAGMLFFDGDIQDGGRYSFGSHAGVVELVLPTGINAEIEALTLVGGIDVDFPGAPEVVEEESGWPGLDEKELIFTVGSGSAQIDVETFSGTIIIRSR